MEDLAASVEMALRWGGRPPTGPIEAWRIENLLRTRRPGPSNVRDWDARVGAFASARCHATAEQAARIRTEVAAMYLDRRAYQDRQRERTRPFEEADTAAMDACPMRAESVRGLSSVETSRRRVCYLDGARLEGRQQRWHSRACWMVWFDNHEWSAARHAARKRDGGCCVRCGSPADPQVNHREPRRGRGYHQGCHHHQANLETLCQAHHVEETNRQRAAAAA